jgi:MinD superfamily P-loop ATPase
MKVAVASGKGGTGKTTVAVNLARSWGSSVSLLDCDVEEPNDHLFLGGRQAGSWPVSLLVPAVDVALCDGCGECSRFCEFHAIATTGGAPIVFPGMCHGCGGCARVCPRGAIREVEERIGVVETWESGAVELVLGRLDVGASLTPPVVNAVKARARGDQSAILDAPAGTSCPVVATLRGSDFVLLVTEPTPFGLHDLELAVELVRELRLPFGVVVNRVGVGDGRVHDTCRAEGIPVLLEIPDDRRIAEAYSRGRLVVDALPEYAGLFGSLAEAVRERAGAAA